MILCEVIDAAQSSELSTVDRIAETKAPANTTYKRPGKCS